MMFRDRSPDGPAGSGKTTVGKMLAAELKWILRWRQFPLAANIEKMSRGIPLSDDDRIPGSIPFARHAAMDAQHGTLSWHVPPEAQLPRAASN